jgi:hypothetical protein
MRNILVRIFILFFTTCLIFGFVFTLWLSSQPSSLEAPNFTQPASTYDTAIQNILLIHVNDLSSPKPILISVWEINIKKTDKLHAFFSMLSPIRAEQGKVDNLQKVFSINHELELSPDFMKSLADISTDWQGFIIVDNITITKILFDIGIKSQPLYNAAARTPEQILALSQTESEILKQTCYRVQQLFNLANLKTAPFISDPAAPVLLRNLQIFTGSQNWICEIP